MQLLLASNNPGKLREFTALLGGLDLFLVRPADIGLELDVEETGDTYQKNACLKAEAFAQASGLWSLADDSGLEVDALNGAPGLYSSRFAPQPDATDQDRREYLLEQLQEQPRPWFARFCCTAVLCSPDGENEIGIGFCPGEIIPEERGRGGFGYDPIFLVNGKNKTMAELEPKIKNQLSHRGVAVRELVPALERIIRVENANNQAENNENQPNLR
jgi:XTP/dITP diphosphohydrolase